MEDILRFVWCEIKPQSTPSETPTFTAQTICLEQLSAQSLTPSMYFVIGTIYTKRCFSKDVLSEPGRNTRAGGPEGYWEVKKQNGSKENTPS